MERLTKRSKATSHENGVCCTHFNGRECHEVMGECAHGCKWEEEAWSKLAEYEDTGLMPEQIEAMKGFANTVGNELAEYKYLEEQGLLHKAPLKDGTPIFVIRTDWEYGDEVCEDFYLHGVTECMVGEINKDYWLTKAEAEQALKMMEKEK